MTNLELLLVLLSVLLMILLIPSLYLLRKLWKNQPPKQEDPKNLVIQILQQQNQRLQDQNQDLLNRLMSQDLSAYATMTGLKESTNLSNQYVSQHDVSELMRLQEAYAQAGSPAGMGDMVDLTDDATEVLGDFGIDTTVTRETRSD